MKSYVDYIFYKTTFLGNKIASEEEFNKLSIEASSYVRMNIFDRDIKGYEEEVKYATCSIAEIIKDLKIQMDSPVNESIGDYSKSFGSKEEIIKNTNIRKKQELKVYLGNTGLLFRGRNV